MAKTVSIESRIEARLAVARNQAMVRLDKCRETLAKQLTEKQGGWDNAATDLAKREGAFAALESTLVFVRREPDATKHEELVRTWGLTRLLAGPEDTWSGRGNDLMRARFDGVRESCEWMAQLIG